MKYSKNELVFFENIDFLNRYSTISKKHDKDLGLTLENTNKEQVLNVLSNLGYKAKYNSKEGFYRIDENINKIEFGFWVSLKYGLVELGIDGENKSKSKILTLGGSFFHRLKYTLGYDLNIPPKAKFSSYEELEIILKQFLEIYKDFKKEFMKEYG